MKTSNKLLLVSASGLIVIILALFLVLRIALETSTDIEKSAKSEGAQLTKQFPLKDFTAIQVIGHWKIDVVRGDATQVIAEAPADVMDTIVVEKRQQTLILENKNRLGKVRASIKLPSLLDLRLKGLISLKLSDFQTDTLSMRTSGATTINGTGNKIRDLSVSAEGVTNLDLRQNPVTNADLRCEGVYKIELSMAGGELSGKVKGVGEVLYNGKVRKEGILRSGHSKVTHQD
jgi:hypothetical protein